jgi:CelD/BcsL family acetyltransferase involved in cellulose biosynthesis
MSITYRVYDSLDAIPLDAGRWDEIAAETRVGSIFLQRNWIFSWWRYLAQDKKLYFVTAIENSHVCAFAPLMIDKSNTLRFIGDMNADYLGFAVPEGRPELINGFFTFLHTNRSDWNVIHLRNIPRDSLLGKQISAASRRSRLHAWRNYSVPAPYLNLSANPKMADKIIRKYSLRRAERQLTNQGAVVFRVFSNDIEAAPHWDLFAAQHKKRCEVADRNSPFNDANYVRFLRSVFEASFRDASAHFSAVFLADTAVAYHYGFVSENRLIWYKPSFDTDIRKASPGLVLIRALLKCARDSGLDELDFTIGEEAFKNRFSDSQRFVDSYRIHKTGLRTATEAAYWRIRRRAKTIFRSKGQ